MAFKWHDFHAHLLRSSSSLRVQRHFREIRQRHVILAGFTDPVALLDWLHRDRDNHERKNSILSALAQAAQAADEAADCALILLLLALWPGLDALHRRSRRRYVGTLEDLPSDILSRATEVIRTLRLDKVSRLAATILRNVERDLRRAHQRDAKRQACLSSYPPEDASLADWRPESTIAARQLQADVEGLIGQDAWVVFAVALAGFSHAEVALRFQVSEAAAKKRYQRALLRLRHELQKNV